MLTSSCESIKDQGYFFKSYHLFFVFYSCKQHDLQIAHLLTFNVYDTYVIKHKPFSFW